MNFDNMESILLWWHSLLWIWRISLTLNLK